MRACDALPAPLVRQRCRAPWGRLEFWRTIIGNRRNAVDSPLRHQLLKLTLYPTCWRQPLAATVRLFRNCID